MRSEQIWKAATIVLALCLAGTLAAQKSPGFATYLTASEIDAVRKNLTGDIQMIVTDAGKYNVGLATMRRNSSGRAETPIVHDRITEVYYVTDGSGVLSTGTATAAKPLPPDNQVVKVLAGPTSMGGTIENAQNRKLAKGDFVIIPPGVAHAFNSIDGSIEYLMVRIDTDRVLPAGLINDIVKKARTE
jgi:mannose-6-phosphate isomerase-like protein (cupin superfamily)